MQLIDWTSADDPRAAGFREHYRRFWCADSDEPAALPYDAIRSRVAAVTERLPVLARRFEDLGILLDGVSLIVFVGSNAGNGHAVRLGDGFAAWLALERYPTPASLDAFLPHELAHAAHYVQVPEFYFHTAGQQGQTGRQLVTEGIATRIAMLSGDLDEGRALWGDFLDPRQRETWLERCRSSHARLASHVVDHWDAALPGNPLFTHGRGREVHEDRGGYYLGLRIAIKLQELRGLSVGQLARMPREAAEREFRSMLDDSSNPDG